ncbi:hypothetical protein MGN70_001688 [Eutypa lata]|nr:hypothetical protein MGN70_001688 [Eutypa lata]
MAEFITPISVRGRYLWKGGDRFIINGVVFQPHRASRREKLPSTPDPLAEDRLEELETSIPLFKELGLNTLFVYFIEPSKNHDAAMDLLAKAGIYVVACLSTPHRSIRRSEPEASYTAELLQSFFRAVDCMAAYNNTLGVVVANEVINSYPSTVAAPVVRAVARDVKRYMAVAAELSGQRVVPVGINSADVPGVIRSQFEYFSAGDEREAIDFFTVKRFEDTHIPVFFSEYGANTSSDGRIFQETRCILSPAMTDTFSGGIVYEFFEGANRYGLVKKNEDGSFEKLQDFENLRESIRACKGLQHSASLEGPGGEIPTPKKFEMPKRSSDWRARPGIPESPLDWDEVTEQIEDRQWVDVEREILDFEVEDLAASVWQRFRIDGTGPRLG